MNDPTIEDSGGGTDTLNENGENNVVLDHFSSARILIAIIVLVVLYLLSKWLVSQQEPNVRVDGNQIFRKCLNFILSSHLELIVKEKQLL